MFPFYIMIFKYKSELFFNSGILLLTDKLMLNFALWLQKKKSFVIAPVVGQF